ncbi:MAG: hypothetical protein IPN86_09060 [Saprospiraceae bacterium]|nr:hypothetical protein [Saprospiraceae bacterium]
MFLKEQLNSDNDPKDPNSLKEGLDYYLEDGNMVFTSYFLTKRGYCCGSGCRHCPYSSNPIKKYINNIS